MKGRCSLSIFLSCSGCLHLYSQLFDLRVSPICACQARLEHKALPLALCTPHDLTSAHWTSPLGPSVAVVSRLSALAKRYLVVLQVGALCVVQIIVLQLSGLKASQIRFVSLSLNAVR